MKLFRSVGQSPSEATLKHIIEKYDPEKTGKIGFRTFLQICESPFFADPIKEERLVECFKMFDDDALGKINVAELRFLLQQIGEPLADDEADKFVEWALKVIHRSTSQVYLSLPIICDGHELACNTPAHIKWKIPWTISEQGVRYAIGIISKSALQVPDAISDGGLLNYDIISRELMNRDPDVS